MTIDAKRLAAAIDDYKAADGVHANRLSYVLERDDARRAAEAGKGKKGTFDPVAFGKQIAAAIEACGWSYRAAADTLGVDDASLHRICQGHRPDGKIMCASDTGSTTPTSSPAAPGRARG